MLRKNIFILCTGFLAYSNMVHCMDMPPEIDSIGIEECLQIARQYLQLQPGILEEQEDVLLKDLGAKGQIRFIKKSLGEHTIFCLLNTDGTPESFSWSIKTDANDWFSLRFCSNKAFEVSDSLLFNAYDESLSIIERRVTQNYSPYVRWMLLDHASKDYNLTWYQVNRYECVGGLDDFMQDDLQKISPLDFFMLNITCCLALKNGDAQVIECFLAHEQIKKCIRPLFGALISESFRYLRCVIDKNIKDLAEQHLEKEGYRYR